MADRIVLNTISYHGHGAIAVSYTHLVYDAKRARTVLDEIGSPNLQILLDPVNLLNMENVDEMCIRDRPWTLPPCSSAGCTAPRPSPRA